MPEVFHILPTMLPENMLTLLVQFTETYPQHTAILKHVEAQPSASAFASQVTLRVPAFTGWWGEGRRQGRAVRALCDLYKSVASEPVQVGRGTPGESGWFSLASVFFSVLRAPAPDASPAQPDYIETEKLLIGTGLSDEEAIRIFNDLREYATNVRPAIARVQGQTYMLFHVLDSVDRFSTLQGAVRGNLFPNCRILHCYQTQALNSTSTYKLFLPDNYQLERAHMERVARLMLTVPQMFGALFAAPARHNLLGFVDSDEDDIGRFVFTANVEFLNEAAVGRDYAFKHYDLIALENIEQSLQQLRKELQRQNQDNRGYRIEMHHSRYSELRDHKREYERILTELEQLQERKADIESYMQLRPRLLRFNQDQLPRLVDVLRAVPPNKLAAISYAFQAFAPTTGSAAPDHALHRQGVHFLYIEPEVRIDFLAPLLLEASQEAPIEFWLDPTWARYYLNQANVSLVFVPKGRMLYPAMHSWDRGNNSMDDYLRQMLTESLAVPKAPIYIFDVDRYTDQDVVISVLDKSRLAPLNSPKYIKWINDNLLMMDRFERIYPNATTPNAFVRLIADDSRTETFARASSQRAADHVFKFSELAESSAYEMAKVTDELAKTLDEEFNGILRRGDDFIALAKLLNARLSDMKTLHDTIQKQVASAELEISNTDKAIGGTNTRVANLKRDVETTIADAQTTTRQAQEQINKKVKDLLERYDEVIKKIEELDRAR